MCKKFINCDPLFLIISFILGLMVGIYISYESYKDAGWCPDCNEIRLVHSESEYCSVCGTKVIIGETRE